MKPVSVDSQKILESLKIAVSNALEKKKRLGQYAVSGMGRSQLSETIPLHMFEVITLTSS